MGSPLLPGHEEAATWAGILEPFLLGSMLEATCLLWDSLPGQGEEPAAVGVTQSPGRDTERCSPGGQGWCRSQCLRPLTRPAPPHWAPRLAFGFLTQQNPSFGAQDTLKG